MHGPLLLDLVNTKNSCVEIGLVPLPYHLPQFSRAWPIGFLIKCATIWHRLRPCCSCFIAAAAAYILYVLLRGDQYLRLVDEPEPPHFVLLRVCRKISPPQDFPRKIRQFGRRNFLMTRQIEVYDVGRR